MPGLEVGQEVSVKGDSGVVRFVGTTKFAAGEWVGVELDKLVGKNDGSLNGVRYFQCQKPGNHGVFVRLTMLDFNSQSKTERSLLEVQGIVDKLQIKLKAAKEEIELYKKGLMDAEQKIQQDSIQIEELETDLEGMSVESEYLKSQNTAISHELEQLQARYTDLAAEYEILQEEVELNRELEEAVKLQVVESQSFTAQDAQLLVQHNRKLEFAVSSLKKLAGDKESKFTEEIKTLKSELTSYKDLRKTYDTTAEKLQLAEIIIAHLQEQLETANELELIIEYLTRENESLNLKNKDLSVTVCELQEIHEIDKSLEENLRKVEQDLKIQIEHLLKQIAQEKFRVEKITSKHLSLQEELNQSKFKETHPSSNGNIELEAANLEVKKVKVELEGIRLSLDISERTLHSLENINGRLVPENYQPHISTLLKIARSLSVLSEIQSRILKSGSSLSQLEALYHFDKIELYLNTLANQLELEYEDLNIDLKALGSELLILSSELKQGFERLLFEDSSSKDSLDFHAGQLRTYLNLAKSSQTRSLYQLCKILPKIRYSNMLCEAILKRLMTDLQAGDCFERLTNLGSQSILLIRRVSLIFSEINISKSHQLADLREIELPEFNLYLISFLKHLESEIVSLDSEMDICEGLPADELENYITAISDALHSLKVELKEIERLPTIFESLLQRKSDPRLSNETESHFEQIEKDSIINDLRLNIEVLERNMNSTIEGKASKIVELQALLEKTKVELKELEEKNKILTNANRKLDSQMQSLSLQNVQTGQNQIRAFEDLKSKKKYTMEMALVEENAMLKKMVSQSSPIRQNNSTFHSWLCEPIYSLTKLPNNSDFIRFETNSREIRAHAAKILSQLLRPRISDAKIFAE